MLRWSSSDSSTVDRDPRERWEVRRVSLGRVLVAGSVAVAELRCAERICSVNLVPASLRTSRRASSSGVALRRRAPALANARRGLGLAGNFVNSWRAAELRSELSCRSGSEPEAVSVSLSSHTHLDARRAWRHLRCGVPPRCPKASASGRSPSVTDPDESVDRRTSLRKLMYRLAHPCRPVKVPESEDPSESARREKWCVERSAG